MVINGNTQKLTDYWNNHKESKRKNSFKIFLHSGNSIKLRNLTVRSERKKKTLNGDKNLKSILIVF